MKKATAILVSLCALLRLGLLIGGVALMLIGIQVSTMDNLQPWQYAVGAGMFLTSILTPLVAFVILSIREVLTSAFQSNSQTEGGH